MRLPASGNRAKGVCYNATWEESTVKLYQIFVVLFLISVLLFVVGTVTANPVLLVLGISMTVALYLARRWFLPRQD